MANKLVTIAVLGYMRCMVGGHGIVTDKHDAFLQRLCSALTKITGMWLWRREMSKIRGAAPMCKCEYITGCRILISLRTKNKF